MTNAQRSANAITTALLALVGCAHSGTAVYIHNNACMPYGADVPDRIILVDGKLISVRGYQMYTCPNGVTVLLYNDERRLP